MTKKIKEVPELRFPGFEGAWKTQELAAIAKIERGRFSPRPRNNPIYYGGDIPFVQTSDVVNAKGRISTFTQTLNEMGLKVSKRFPKGTILITIAANIGHTAVLEIPMACPDSLVGISCGKGTHNFFLNYILEKEQPKMDYLAVEAAQKNINIAFLEVYLLTLPLTLPEQQKIADFLTAVDKRIQQLRQKKALLEDYKKGVMQQLFTQALRFKDDCGIDFPDWEEKRLIDLCSTFKSGKGITSEQIHEAGEYPVYGGNGLRGYTDTFTHDGVFLLIGRQGALCGNINRVSGRSYISEHAIAVSGNKWANTEWLAQRLDYLNLNRLSESSAQPGLAVNKLERLKIFTPSLPEQTKIANFLTALDRKIETVAAQITHTQTFKKGLLQQMFV
jgi:type I restriction enzyme S subunit